MKDRLCPEGRINDCEYACLIDKISSRGNIRFSIRKGAKSYLRLLGLLRIAFCKFYSVFCADLELSDISHITNVLRLYKTERDEICFNHRKIYFQHRKNISQ